MNYYVSVAFSFSIAIAAIIGWTRFPKIGPAFYPFLALVTLGTLNELTSFIVIQNGHSNAVNANIYSLLEACLIVWQFERWGLFTRKKKLFWLLLAFLILAWITENFFIASITQFSSYFNIIYGLLNVFMSITMINWLLVNDTTPLLKNPVFLICCCFSIFYTYSALVEIYWTWGLGGSKQFRLNIFRILYSINLLANLIYAVAMLWIPRKRKFITLS